MAPVTLPAASICPNAIVNPDVLFKSLTLSNVGIVANACKFFKSSGLSPPGPAEVTTGGISGGGANTSAGPVTLGVVNG